MRINTTIRYLLPPKFVFLLELKKMGASSSSQTTSTDQQEQESIASTSPLSLSSLHSSFSLLSQSPSSLPKLFSIKTPNDSNNFFPNLSRSIYSLLFPSSKDPITWVDFLKGYNRCCTRMPASDSLNLLLRVYYETCLNSEIGCKLEFDDGSEQVGGILSTKDLLMIFHMCWVMDRDWRVQIETADFLVLEFTHLVLSVMVVGGEIAEDDEMIWDFDVLENEKKVSVEKFRSWVLSCAPGILNCLSKFVIERIKAFGVEPSSEHPNLAAGDSSSSSESAFLLTCGRAWAISLTLRNNLSEELSGAAFPELYNGALDNILYRSAIHGKGLNRFWSNVDGYNGPVLILISVSSISSSHKSVIGILTEQGYANHDTFYGDSGFLYAISPIFRSFSPFGKEKNFIYSHLHPTGRYEPNPKPVGLGFGGTSGNERLFIDEDFSKVTIRHHAVDKTYQHGSLVPNQGFLPVEARILEIEAWGFGGNAAKQKQDAHKKRENLFTEQRRKVDLKTFGNWEDSPEKMMMDMVTDPNAVRREDR